MLTVLFLWVSVTWAGMTSPTTLEVEVKVKAKVSQDLRTITGTIEADEHPGLRWVDLMSKMPIPTSDRIEQRTFTDLPEAGGPPGAKSQVPTDPASFIRCFLDASARTDSFLVEASSPMVCGTPTLSSMTASPSFDGPSRWRSLQAPSVF